MLEKDKRKMSSKHEFDAQGVEEGNGAVMTRENDDDNDQDDDDDEDVDDDEEVDDDDDEEVDEAELDEVGVDEAPKGNSSGFMTSSTAMGEALRSCSPVGGDDLDHKVKEMHRALSSQEEQIQKLKQKSEDASRTIEKLQMQLKMQSDYELLKREIQLLKSAAGGALGVDNLIGFGSTKAQPPASTTPPMQGSTTGVNNNNSSSQPIPGANSLELLLLERAKALQANPALKALADLQGHHHSPFPGLANAAAAAAAAAATGNPVRHPLFPGAPPPGLLPPGMEAALGLMNDEMLSQWRRSLEQNSPLLQHHNPLSPASPSMSPSRRNSGTLQPPPPAPLTTTTMATATTSSTTSPAGMLGSSNSPAASSSILRTNSASSANNGSSSGTTTSVLGTIRPKSPSFLGISGSSPAAVSARASPRSTSSQQGDHPAARARSRSPLGGGGDREDRCEKSSPFPRQDPQQVSSALGTTNPSSNGTAAGFRIPLGGGGSDDNDDDDDEDRDVLTPPPPQPPPPQYGDSQSPALTVVKGEPHHHHHLHQHHQHHQEGRPGGLPTPPSGSGILQHPAPMSHVTPMPPHSGAVTLSSPSPLPSFHGSAHPGAMGLALPLTLSAVVPPLLSTGRIPKSDPMEARLQDMLRFNMEKYAGQALDTLSMSRRVRELLSIHNIGQRLFAKYVLGLSQGTVSELLSKPKSWEKLTEKGRDSYRKMHAWAYDENAIMLLKSLIPRKDERGSTPCFPFGQNGSEERIAKILSEANKAMGAQGSLGPIKESHGAHSPTSNVSVSMNLPSQLQQPPSVHSSSAKSPSTGVHLSMVGISPTCDDHNGNLNPQERMSKLYQEELAKIMRQRGLPPIPTSLTLPIMSPPTSNAAANSTLPQASSSVDKMVDAVNPLSGLPVPGLPASLPFFPGLAGSLFAPKVVPGPAPGGPDLQRAMDLYHQEFSRLQQNALAAALRAQNGGCGTPKELQDGSIAGSGAGSPGSRSDSDMGVPSLKLEGNKDSASIRTPDKDLLDGSKLSPLHPLESPLGKSPGSTLFPATGPPPTATSEDAISLSPLQRMASITNSLVTQAPLTSGAGHSTRPMKAVLPPITQQQFDKFSHLNTDEIVRRIKEILSQYSISQRLFGESVLGLSQGSVSDLLARPKPWHMLTQKGREPFIRMKLFLDDENAVHKLVASQYKIAPEKLMRTGDYSGSLFPSPKQIPKLPDFARSLGGDNPMMPGHHLRFGMAGALGTPPPPPPGQGVAGLLDRNPPILDPLAIHRKLLSQQNSAAMSSAVAAAAAAAAAAAGGSLVGGPSANPAAALLMDSAGCLSSPAPSLYEMAALTHELDTQSVTTKVKEILLANNVGQKLFGEAVLGLSQGSVSELLSKPKPWHMLSIKGREPFIRMQLWLNDPQNIEKLQALKSEKREPGKRKRPLGGSGSGVGVGGGSGLDSSSDRSSPADPCDLYASSADSPGSTSAAAKKQRVLFSDEQKEALRIAFALDPYPGTAAVDYLSQELNLEARTIGNWFHNHRMRLKQQLPPGMDGLVPFLSKGGPSAAGSSVGTEGSQNFDPIKFKLILHQRMLELQQSAVAEATATRGSGGVTGEEVAEPPHLTMSALMLRQFGHAPLVNLLGDFSTFEALGLTAKGLLPGVGGGATAEALMVGGGLDLSFKRSSNIAAAGATAGDRDDDDDDRDDLVAAANDSPAPRSEDNEDSNEAMTEAAQRRCSAPAAAAVSVAAAAAAILASASLVGGAGPGRSSRRKPAAPQWVRPEWMEDKDGGVEATADKNPESSDGGGGMTINGVCVMNAYAFGGAGGGGNSDGCDVDESKEEDNHRSRSDCSPTSLPPVTTATNDGDGGDLDGDQA